MPNKQTFDALRKQREPVADAIFESYDFGDVEVIEHDRWNSDVVDDFTKVAYVKYPEDAIDEDSHKVSFHVRFEGYKVIDAYALEMDHGNDIGRRTDNIKSFPA